MNIHIETDRLIIRDIEEIDEKGMFELESDPLVHKYLGGRPIKTIEESKELINYIRNQYKENGIGRWAIIHKENNDFVGWTGLKLEQQVRPDIKYYDLGYRIRRNYWGRGIATETVIESLKYGFIKLKLKKICAAAHINNEASNKILSKVGLELLETFNYDGALHNWYQIKKEDWLDVVER